MTTKEYIEEIKFAYTKARFNRSRVLTIISAPRGFLPVEADTKFASANYVWHAKVLPRQIRLTPKQIISLTRGINRAKRKGLMS